MVAFSSDYRRSTKSFVVSFLIHVSLIIGLSLFLLDFGGRNVISVFVSSIEDGDELMTLLTPEFESTEVDMSFLNPATEIPKQQQLENFVKDVTLDLDYSPGAKGGSNASFFGISATGDRLVFIIDMSISMGHANYRQSRYERAVEEVLNSISQLQPDQKFFVYLFCFEKTEMSIGQPSGEFCSPTLENQKKLESWLNKIKLGSGTDPRESLVSALQKRPSCVFLLSDGQFNGPRFNNGRYGRGTTAVELAKTTNTAGCPVHTIGLEDRKNQRVLTRIADQSGGSYRFVTGGD